MDAEVQNLLKLAAETIVKSASTDLYSTIVSRFKKIIARSKRAEAGARLDMTLERVRQAPECADDEAESLFEDLRPLVDLDKLTLQDFVSSATELIREAKPSMVASGDVVHAHQVNFIRQSTGTPTPDESREMLYDVLDAIQASMASQRELGDELAKAHRLAWESQKEAKAAQQGVFMMSTLVLELKHKIDGLEHERDLLLTQMEDANRRGGDIPELERKLSSALEDARRSQDLYQQSQRDLQVAKQQQEAAERFAEEAVTRFERRQESRGGDRDIRPELERYEEKLDSLANDRRATQERIREISKSLSSTPLPLPALPADPPTSTVATPGTPASADLSQENAAEKQSPAVVTVPAAATSVQESSSGGQERERYGLGVFVAIAFGALAFAAIIAGLVMWLQLGSRDGWIGLASVPVTGDKPTHGQDGVAELDFALRSGLASTTTFTAGGDASRYFNTELRTTSPSSNCSSSATVAYEIYTNGRLISHGTIPANGANHYVNDLSVGRDTQLEFAATLHGTTGCRVTLQLETPTLDKLTGWERNLGDFGAG